MNDGNTSGPGHHPTPLEAGLERAMSPFQEFIHDQTSASVMLLLCTLLALVIANSPLAQDYQRLIHMQLGLVLGEQSFSMSIGHWVNEALMALFFFILGLEIKREILVGELQDPQQSLPVIAAASGGMLLPASIFLLFNQGSATVHGWGIPMATDAAFAIGVLALLGRRIPPALLTFLTALAIIDDLGAILVIAVFYTATINLASLTMAGLLLLLLVACNLGGCRHPLVYIIGGALVWLAMLGSGVHATVAGVLVAMTVPARPKREPEWFVRRARRLINDFEAIGNKSDRPILGEDEQHRVVEKVQDTAEKATTPLRRWERALEHPVALLVMPIFALANAGIAIDSQTLNSLWHDRLALGIALGLVLGKPLGIVLFTWLALRLRLGRLPQGVNMRHIIGIGLVGGMGFTMSIFITGLGFSDSPALMAEAKITILLASLAAGLLGYGWLAAQPSASREAAG